jgi:hypothetical protein
MKKSFTNISHVEGLLYDHNLEIKKTGKNSKRPGTEYIRGDVSIVTDSTMMNVVQVYYTYVTATTSSGKTDSRWTALKDIIDGKRKTVVGSGADQAAMIRIDSAVGLNEFYVDSRENPGTQELVSAKRNEGGFIHFDGSGENGIMVPNEHKRATFKTDMVITNVFEREANEERNLPAKAVIKGWIFDFRNAIYPVEFSAVEPNAINYFLSLEASPKNPIVTQVWGEQISETSVRKIVTESAFGPDDVREIPSTRKDFVITGASREPGVWDDESWITAAEFNKAMSDREVYLATRKQRSDECKANRAKTTQASAFSSTDVPAAGEFKF